MFSISLLNELRLNVKNTGYIMRPCRAAMETFKWNFKKSYSTIIWQQLLVNCEKVTCQIE